VRLALLAEAEAELENAAAWYDDRSEGLGDEFLSVAREAAHLIAESAETWPMWPGAPAAFRQSGVSCCVSVRSRASQT